MELDPSFALHDDGRNSKIFFPMASPPLDLVSFTSVPFEVHEAHHARNLDRKRNLEYQLLPYEKCFRGAAPFTNPQMELDYENDLTYHYFPEGSYGENTRSFHFGNAVVPSDCKRPSPFGVRTGDFSSISESDRSPSPQAFGCCGLSDINSIDSDTTHTSYPIIYNGDATGCGSVVPRDVHHIHEDVGYPEGPQKVSQSYGPCESLRLNPGEAQYEILSDLQIDDDVDADGEPDAMCDHDIDPALAPPKSKMPPKAKKSPRPRTLSHQRNPSSSRSSGIRKRTTPRKISQSSSPKIEKQLAPTVWEQSPGDGRTYACSFKRYGCKSTFSSKNEWKRHFSSQHLKLSFYRCDLQGCCPSATRGPNDFNRKDLFTQHLRRMHAPWSGKGNPTREEKNKFEEGLDDHHRRCLQAQRQPPPQSQCTMCNQVFTDWQGRMEHMSKHYEADSRFNEPEDPDLVKWALQEGILSMKARSNEIGLTDERDRNKSS